MSLNTAVPRSLSSHCPFTPVKSVYHGENAESLQSGRKQPGALWLDSLIAMLLSRNISSSQCLIVCADISARWDSCPRWSPAHWAALLPPAETQQRRAQREKSLLKLTLSCSGTDIKNWLMLYEWYSIRSDYFSVICQLWVCCCWSTDICTLIKLTGVWTFFLVLGNSSAIKWS